MPGVTLKEPINDEGECSKGELEDEELGKMLAKDLSPEEKEEFKVMLRKHPSLFISDYCEISGVTAIEHQINLKTNQKPVGSKAKTPWEDPRRGIVDGSKEATPSWLHLSCGRFRVGVPSGGDPKKEW